MVANRCAMSRTSKPTVEWTGSIRHVPTGSATSVGVRSVIVMPGIVRASPAPSLRGRPCPCPESARQLSAAADVQLAVGAGQVHLDGLDGEEQRLGDVSVGSAGRGQLGYPALAGGEAVDAVERRATDPDAARSQLGA